MTEPVKRAFVIGSPVAHSLSPDLHSFWLNQYNIDGSYEKIEVLPEDLELFLGRIDENNFVGGNITIPHKENAYQILNQHSETANQLRAINTIWLEDNILHSHNTDSYGFAANLDDFAPHWRNYHSAVVLGAGGAAKSIIWALLEVGYKQVQIVNRTVSRARELVDHFGDRCTAITYEELPGELSGCQLLINTTSLGMKGQNKLEIDLSPLPGEAIVTDIVYNPLKTELLAQAEQFGLTIVDGIGMLLHQAVPGFEKWFGIRPEVSPKLRSHMLNILNGKQS